MKKVEKKEKLKVGFLSYYPPTYGGATRLATRMATHLTEEGHEAHFIGYHTDINPDYLKEKGIVLHKAGDIQFPATKNQFPTWLLANKIVDVHKEVGFDLLHVHFAIPYGLSAFLAREKIKEDTGKYLPYVLTGHGTDIHTYGNHPDINSMVKLALSKADATTYVGENLKDLAKRKLGDKKGRVVTNFVETDIFYKEKSDLREKYNIPEDAFVVGHASNFAPIKQTDHFIHLSHEISNRGLDNIYFLMCGDGELKNELERKLELQGMINKFIFLGKLESDDIRKAYSTMNVSLMTSEREGCPLAALESMACETPVIGSEVSGLKDLLRNNVGYLFKPYDTTELTDIIENLSKNPEKLKEHGRYLRGYIEKNHSVSAIMSDYMNIYREIIDSKKRLK